MWRLPGLLSQAAAAGRAAARTSSGHVRGSKGFSSGGDGSPLPRGWLRRLWIEELKREKEAARRLGGGALVCKAEGVGEDPLGYLANAARAFVNSGSAAAGIDKVRAGGAARGEVAPSKGGHYDPKDLPYLEASGFCNF
uniref:Uncharacterized protein n=1 Tax=Aegilops tauschii TaxID=37682 RepID=N1QSE5_AEGTA